MSDNELITVRWQDEQDGGWREGVILIALDRDMTESDMCGIRFLIENRSQGYEAIIYDRHRHERAIVPLAKVQIVEPACEACEGTGKLNGSTVEAVATSKNGYLWYKCCECGDMWTAREPEPCQKCSTETKTCSACHGSGKGA